MAGLRGDQIRDAEGATAGVDTTPWHSHASQRGAGSKSLLMWTLLGRVIVDLTYCRFAAASLSVATATAVIVAPAGVGIMVSQEEPRGGHCSRCPEARPQPQKSTGSLQPHGQGHSPLRRPCPHILGQPLPVSSALSASGGNGARRTRLGCATNPSPPPYCLSTSRPRGAAATGLYTRWRVAAHVLREQCAMLKQQPVDPAPTPPPKCGAVA